MRIAVIETAPYGGLLHYSVQLGNGLAQRGHDVDLITPATTSWSIGPARPGCVPC